MYRTLDFVIEQYKVIFVAICILTLPFLYGYLNQSFSNTIESEFDQDDAYLLKYKEFQGQFGNEDAALIAIAAETVLDKDVLRLIRDISGMIKSLKGIQTVRSLTDMELVTGNDDIIDFKQVIPGGQITDEVVSEAEQMILRFREDRYCFVTDDFKNAIVEFTIESTVDGQKKKQILDNIRDTVNDLAGGKNLKVYYSGMPFFETISSSNVEYDIRFLTPVMLIALFVLTIIGTGNIALSVIIISCSGLVAATATGLMILSGETVNFVTVMTGCITMILSHISSFHIILRYRRIFLDNGFNHLDAVEKTIKEKRNVCLASAVANSMVFFAYSISSVRSLKIAGIFIIFGAIHIFFISIIFLPSVLLVFKKWIAVRPRKIEQIVIRLSDVFFVKWRFSIYRNSLAVLAALLMAGIVLISGLIQLKHDTLFTRYVNNDKRLRGDTDYIEKKITGTVYTEVVIRSLSTENNFNRPEGLLFLKTVQERLTNRFKREIYSVYSVTDYISELNRAFNGGAQEYFKIPESPMEINDYYELGDASVFKQLISQDKRETRLSVKIGHNNNRLPHQFEAVIQPLFEDAKGKYTYWITGLSSLPFRHEENLKISEKRLFGLILFFCLIVFYTITRRLKAAIIGTLAALIPILTVLGTMGLFGLSIYTPTLMLLGLVTATAVDAIVRFFIAENQEVEKTDGITPGSIDETVKGIWISVTIPAMALLVFIFGATVPVKIFGILACIATLSVAVSTLIFLPAALGLPESVQKEGATGAGTGKTG